MEVWTNHTVISNDSALRDSSLALGITGIVTLPVMLVILFLILFVYKTYKITFQRLIVYYIVLTMWFDFSLAVQILAAFSVIEERWANIIVYYLLFSSQFAW